MGLLDGFFSDDPRQQAQLALAMGLLSGGGGKGFGGFARDLGRAGMGAQGVYNQASLLKDRRAEEEQQRKLRDMQMEQLKRTNEYQGGYDSLAKQYFNQGSPAIPFNDSLGDGTQGNVREAQAPRSDLAGFIGALPSLGGQGVKDSIALQQSMAKDSAFSKIDPKDYTAESIRRFSMSAQAGKPDFSILEPVRKREVVDGRVIDPYAVAPGSEITGPQSGVVPNGRGGYMFNPAKINPVEIANFGVSRARAADEGIGGLPGIPGGSGGFITGGVSGPIQRGPSPMPQPAPQGAPTAPVAAPAGVLGLSPKQQRDIAAKAAEKATMNQVDAKSALPNVAAEANQTLALIDKMVSHPGLGDVVGAKWAGGLPTAFGLPPIAATDAADFTALKDQLLGKQFLQAYDSLKGSGQITEVEGAKATNAIARMSTAQSEKAFKEAAQEFRDVVEAGLSRAKAKAGSAQEAPAETKRVRLGNKEYEAKLGKHGKYYIKMGNSYYEVSE